MKNKLFNKKGDSLSSIIVSIVFIILALIMIPAFRGMQVDNTNATNAISRSHISFVNEGLTDAGAGANYQLDNDVWDTTDATNVQ
jgi:hypothetical protein